MEKFGQNFGIIRQIKNDLRDLFRVKAKSDAKLGEKTLSLVYLASVSKQNREKTKELHQLCLPAQQKGPEFGSVETDRLRQFIIQEVLRVVLMNGGKG